MKKLFALALVLGFSVATHAQTHSASVTWTLSTSTAVVSQNVYRSADAGVTFTKLAAGTALGPAVTSFTDSTVAAGASYQYYVTAVCPTTGACVGESVPSNKVTAVIPGNPPPPPTGLTIGSVAMNTTGGVETALAKWSDTSGTQQSFFFTDGSKVIAQGLTSSLTGTFAEQWKGTPTSTVWFTVCNSVGACATQKAM